MSLKQAAYKTPAYIESQRSLHVPDETKGDQVARREVRRSLPFLKATDWVLDLGCKTGEEQLVWRRHGILNTIGLDLFPEKALAKGVTVIRHDMHALPFSDGAFDFVYCRDTLEHSPEPEQAFQEAMRVLRPGGRALFVGPVNHKAEYHWSVFSVEQYRELFRPCLEQELLDGDPEAPSQYIALLRKLLL